MKKTNPWITHVKNYAQAHNMKYGCALSDPKCKSTYKSRSGDGLFGDIARSVGKVVGNVAREGVKGYKKGSQ